MSQNKYFFTVGTACWLQSLFFQPKCAISHCGKYHVVSLYNSDGVRLEETVCRTQTFAEAANLIQLLSILSNAHRDYKIGARHSGEKFEETLIAIHAAAVQCERRIEEAQKSGNSTQNDVQTARV